MARQVPRRRTREIHVGWVKLGGDHPVAVQSMTNTDTRDVESTVEQIRQLEEEGCEIIRVAIPDLEAAEALRRIIPRIGIPLIADIHFDWRLAVAALKAGAHGIRINPGNIKGRSNVRKVIEAARACGACVRIGVNAGSLERDLLRKYGWPRPEALVESALRWLDFVVGDLGFENLKVSLKSSDLWHTVTAYREFSRRSDFPVHIGVTEAGGLIPGTVKSALGLGLLLSEGIGDTLRVSLTAPPVEEVRVAWEILKAVGIRRRGAEIVACPTCGRCEIDLMSLYQEVERYARNLKAPIKIAVMGCVVNGPGEAREADIGLAGGKGVGIIFREGKIIRKVTEDQLLPAFLEEIERLLRERNRSQRRE
ncbi:MAG TPA: flavodoxin-dependent (E)-4-hydroxy-3-methylbut-2-enyl-diphosphate synthase [Thermosulfurimonas dismutans]|uniref:4-hydroxy-3-methylbut-2-en-1-yl diphosphate synthase (flavodoxin) n=1 Tax=Thermosulfurimonas dismutans TaxID=999894 RepID=A0A7C3GTV6_9BACT|nr:flavodoxin-dependent (E)-4-hydroxy-3-methylbut-2-enyl-diphosphate synthase [Thermosulfurimonas dismutans]